MPNLKKRILIVDDDWDILFLLAHGAKRLSPNYEVVTAMDGASALAEARKQPFDLVLTDHMMPEMTGGELAQAIRQLSPQTQIILMTAYEPNRMNNVLDTVELDGYIGKPFQIPQVLEVISQIITGKTDKITGADLSPAPALPQRVTGLLKELWRETGAHIVLLLNTNGEPLKTVGETDQAKISRLASFVSASFLAVTELASLLGDNRSTFKSSYHEGNRYNLYSLNLNGKFLLTVVFGADRKPGSIWIYTRQTATALLPLLNQSP